MTTGSSSQKGVFKIPGKEGSVFTVNLPDGSPRYILLQEVDGLVRLLEENYQGGKEPINPIEELDGLISIIKQNSNTVDISNALNNALNKNSQYTNSVGIQPTGQQLQQQIPPSQFQNPMNAAPEGYSLF